MLHDILYRLRAILRRNTREAELEEELAFHLEQQTETHVREGVSRDEATRRARLALDGVERLKEDCRDARGIALWDSTVQDLSYALRQYFRNPGFSLAIVLTLGLGMGATTALFSVANAVLVRALPVPNPHELVMIARDPARPFPLHSFAQYRLIRDESHDALTGVAAFNSGNAVGFSTLDAGGREVPEVVSTAFVSGNYFDVLGIPSSAGRLLAQADENPPEGNQPVVLSYAFWQRRLAGSFAVLGRPVRLNGAICIVAGIAQRNFNGTIAGSTPDLYVPLTAFPSILPIMRNNWNAPTRQWLCLIARLQPGVGMAQAAARLDSLAGDSRRVRMVLLPAAHAFSPAWSQITEPLLILLSAAGLLLALACANVAGLLLARSIHRQREIALRLALGAGRLRLIRQLLTESVLLALLGGIAGLLVGSMGARALVRFLPSGGPFPFALDVSPDARVFGFACVVSLITGLLFGLGPALRASRWDLATALKGSPAATRRAGWLRLDLRRALVVTQVSLSLVLLVGVALLAQSLAHLGALDLGYARAGVLFVNVQPSQFGYQGARAQQFYERLRERVAALPGVSQTSLADFAPLDSGNDSQTVSGPGLDTPIQVETNTVTEGYLGTLGIPLVAGRDFLPQDARQGALPVVLVSESLSRLLFRKDSPIGHRLSFGERYQAGESAQIVGVVRDARYFGLRERPTPMVYTPIDPALGRLVLCVRTTGAPERLVPAVRREVAALDSAVPVLEAATMTERLDNENAQPRMLATLLGAFGLMALVLAGIGLYGVLAFWVAARTREIGIRSALGARRWDAVARVLADVGTLVGAGVVIGSIASLAAVRLLAGFLFGVQPVDLVSFIAAIGILAVTAAVASYVPARRAAGVDPSVALKHE